MVEVVGVGVRLVWKGMGGSSGGGGENMLVGVQAVWYSLLMEHFTPWHHPRTRYRTVTGIHR
jgi:hypothetical protein